MFWVAFVRLKSVFGELVTYFPTRDRSDKGFQGLKPNSAHFYRRIEALRLPRGRGEIDSVQKDRQDL